MLKVILKAEDVVIRVKERISMEVLVAKDSEKLPVAQGCSLVDGRASVNRTAEFFITQKDPVFKVQVELIFQQARKLGGQCRVALQEWEPQVCHKAEALMLRSPDKEARLGYSFIFFEVRGLQPERPLLSWDSAIADGQRRQMEEINMLYASLWAQHSKACSQLSSLKAENQNLQQHQEQMAQRLDLQEKDALQHQHEDARLLRVSDLRARNSEASLSNLVSLIREFGESPLIQKLTELAPDSFPAEAPTHDTRLSRSDSTALPERA